MEELEAAGHITLTPRKEGEQGLADPQPPFSANVVLDPSPETALPTVGKALHRDAGARLLGDSRSCQVDS